MFSSIFILAGLIALFLVDRIWAKYNITIGSVWQSKNNKRKYVILSINNDQIVISSKNSTLRYIYNKKVFLRQFKKVLI